MAHGRVHLGHPQPMTLVSDALVARLREWGVHRVFGYAGDGIDPILAALNRAGGDPELVTTRHEEMAAFMASGHAKYTGEVGVCLSTQGPGAIHLLAGLYDAKLDRKPVVAIVGQVVTTALGSGYLQEVDLQTLFKDVCGQYVMTVTSPEQFPLVLDNAFRTALATSSPTCVIVPHDVQKAELPEQEHTHGVVSTSTAFSRPRVIPPEEDLDHAVELLRSCERPALLVGQGASGAADEGVARAAAEGPPAPRRGGARPPRAPGPGRPAAPAGKAAARRVAAVPLRGHGAP